MNTVIIRSKNEQRYIGYCVQSVTDFIGKPKIVLIDNESTDNTVPIVNRFEYHDVTKLHISKDDYSPGKALNMGIKESEGDWIIIISAHCEIVQLDLDKVREHFSDPAVVAVWGNRFQFGMVNGQRVDICGLISEMNNKQIIGVSWKIDIFSIMPFQFLRLNIWEII